MHNICICCLSWDRQLFPVNKYMSILSDITQNMTVFLLQGKVCWECQAYLKRIQFFKERTLQSIALLQQYGDVNKLKHQHIIQPILSRSNIKIVDCSSLPKSQPTVIQTNDKILTNKIYYIGQTGSQYLINGVDKLSSPLLLPINPLIPNNENSNDNNVNLNDIKTEVDNTDLGISVKPEPIDEETMNKAGDLQETIVPDSEESDCVIECIIENPPKKEKIVKSHKMTREPQVTEVPGVWCSELVSDSQMLKWRASDANENDYLKSPYKCVQCILGFINAYSWRSHHDISHNRRIGQYVCDVCQTRFAEEYILNEHRDNHKRLYKCLKCGMTNRKSTIIIQHCNTAHCGAENDSPRCDCVGRSNCEKCRVKKKNEIQNVTYNYSYKCGVCSENFITRTELTRHINQHHTEQSKDSQNQGAVRPYGCGDCDKKFRFSGELLSHRLLFHRRSASVNMAASSSSS